MAKRKRFGRVMAPAALLLPLGLAPLSAQALGLGALRVNSALGQPLNARIELIGATAAEAELATISLASAQTHERLGVDSALGGVQLRFEVKVGADGRSYVNVRSNEPVREPYIDFVVEAISPTGQVARHYTVLLDPVGASASPAPTARWSPPVTSMASGQSSAAPRHSNPFANVGAPTAGSVFGPVPPGATLWAIARRVRPTGAALDGVMSSIVRANPAAFIDGDPARLRAGSRLSIPPAQSLREAPGAISPVTEDAGAPDSRPPAQPQPAETAPAASAAGAVESAAETPQAEGEVRVLRAPDAEPARQAVAGAAPENASGNRIALLEEALDAAHQQNELLETRMKALEEQIRTLSELVQAGPAAPTDKPAPAAESPAPADASVQAPAPAEPAPAVPAQVTPAQAPAPPAKPPSADEADSAPPVYALAAVAGIGLVGLLAWARRRRAAAEASGDFNDNDGVDADVGMQASASPPPAPATPAEARPSAVTWIQNPLVSEAEPQAVPEAAADGFGDPVDTQIDLLTAYVGMADGPSARQIHDEIQRTGTPAQKAQAAALLARLDA